MKSYWPPTLHRALEREREWRLRSVGQLLSYEVQIADLRAEVARQAQVIADLRGDAATTS